MTASEIFGNGRGTVTVKHTSGLSYKLDGVIGGKVTDEALSELASAQGCLVKVTRNYKTERNKGKVTRSLEPDILMQLPLAD